MISGLAWWRKVATLHCCYEAVQTAVTDIAGHSRQLTSNLLEERTSIAGQEWSGSVHDGIELLIRQSDRRYRHTSDGRVGVHASQRAQRIGLIDRQAGRHEAVPQFKLTRSAAVNINRDLVPGVAWRALPGPKL